MPSWKKIIVSGSNPELNNITSSGDIFAEGNISGSSTSTGSFGRVEVPAQSGGGPITLGGGAYQDVIIGDGSGTADIVLDGNSESVIRYKIGGNEKWFLLARSSNNFVFRRNSADRVTIDTNGNFAIGSNLVPTERLHVGGNIFATGNISGSATSTGSFGALKINGSPLITGDSSGIGIGKENPTAAIDIQDVRGTIQIGTQANNNPEIRLTGTGVYGANIILDGANSGHGAVSVKIEDFYLGQQYGAGGDFHIDTTLG